MKAITDPDLLHEFVEKLIQEVDELRVKIYPAATAYFMQRRDDDVAAISMESQVIKIAKDKELEAMSEWEEGRPFRATILERSLNPQQALWPIYALLDKMLPLPTFSESPDNITEVEKSRHYDELIMMYEKDYIDNIDKLESNWAESTRTWMHDIHPAVWSLNSHKSRLLPLLDKLSTLRVSEEVHLDNDEIELISTQHDKAMADATKELNIIIIKHTRN